MKVELLADGARWNLNNDAQAFVSGLAVPTAVALTEAAAASGLTLGGQTSFQLDSTAVSQLPEAAAVALGLPSNCPLTLDLKCSGVLGQPDCRLEIRWLKPGKTLAVRNVQVAGCWIDWEDKRYRIPHVVFQVIGAAARFNAKGDADQDVLDRQFRAWAEVRQALGETAAEQLNDHYLRSVRIVVPTMFTISISDDGQGGVQLDPVLLHDVNQLDADGTRRVPALLAADEPVMTRRLDEMHDGAQAFPIGNGTYVVVEESLREALATLKQLRRAPQAERKRAAITPEAVMRELLGKPEGAPIPFLETESYSERVLDISQWQPPAIPWIKIPPQDWAPPVAAGIRIGGKDIPLDLDTLQALQQATSAAIEQGKPSAAVGKVEIAATPENLRVLQALEKSIRRRLEGPRSQPESEYEPSPVLIIETNLEDAAFDKAKVSPRPGRPNWPTGIQTRPKDYQELGLRWLQSHWCAGNTGAMLCDDMGLGKTFQALTFAKWLRDQMDAGLIQAKPILVIAPVGLLVNWEAEHGRHLMAPGIGNILKVYGDHVKGLKRGSHREGTAKLDTARIGEADLVLANYEAVTEYQLSFGAIHFAAIILDEAQRIKSPATRITHAVKGLNTDFFIAMTGTPVENRLADLWCIADAVQPFSLRDLKSFSARYEVDGGPVVELRNAIWHDEKDDIEKPRLLLRRLKTDKLEGLPKKIEHTVRIPMPPRQQEVYERCLALNTSDEGGSTLALIQSLRRSSLHPMLVEVGLGVGEEMRIEDSARMLALLQILDKVQAANEKALVFLESLDLQDSAQLPMLLQRRYKLPRLPMVINGQVATADRQQRVDRFQAEAGFDVMLLSPRAGGVGLTITAANHVIHLSRWWNPAVEDQCSDRVYRIGQTKTVHIYYPLAVLPGNEESSFDVQLQLLMDRKRHLARNLLAAPAFSPQEYTDLLIGTRRGR